MPLSYQARYRPSPNLAGAVSGTIGFLLPVFAPLPLWVVLVFAAAAVVCAAWTVSLALRCHIALRADTDGLVLSTPGSVLRREQLTVPWSQVSRIRVVESEERGVAVPYLEIVRRAGAPPAPAAFTRPADTSGATRHVRLALCGWLPDRQRLRVIAKSSAPQVRFSTAVPDAIAWAEQTRELDRSMGGQRITPKGLRFLWRYMFGLFAWLMLGAVLLDQALPDLEAQAGAGRPGVWTAGPERCGKSACSVQGDFVSDDGTVVRTDLSLRGDSSLYPTGHQIRVVDAGSLDYVYPPEDLGNEWPSSVGIALVLALPLGFWIWRVPVRSARETRPCPVGPHTTEHWSAVTN
jgi:hypothetical protein